MNSQAGPGLLLLVLGFWLISRSVNKDSSHRTLIDYLTGSSGSTSALVSVPSPSIGSTVGNAITGAGNAIGGALGTKAIPGNLKFAGVDQGVDFTGSGPIPAVIQGTVTRVVPRGGPSGWPGGGMVVVQGTGPDAGKFTYLAENFDPTVRVGQQVSRGSVIGKAVGVYPYIEYGFAANAQGETLTRATAPGQIPNRHSAGTDAGRAFKKWIGL